MTNKPPKTCSIERLVTQPRLVALVKSGQKTQQRRNGVYAWPGETFALDGRIFVITDLQRQRIGDMTDVDAMAEGFASLAAYKEVIAAMHGGMTWNHDGLVWVHCFREETANLTGVNS